MAIGATATYTQECTCGCIESKNNQKLRYLENFTDMGMPYLLIKYIILYTYYIGLIINLHPANLDIVTK